MHRKEDGTAFEYWQIPELTVDGDQFDFRLSPQADDRLIQWLGTVFVVGVTIMFGLLVPMAILSGEKGLSGGNLFGVFWFALLAVLNAYLWKLDLRSIHVSSERVDFLHPIYKVSVPLIEIEEALITHQRFWGSFIIKLKRKGGSWKWYGRGRPNPPGPATANRAIAILTEEFEYRGIPCRSKLT